MPSFTLSPGGNDRSVMSLHFPVFRPFGMTPKRLMWHGGRDTWTDTENGPSMRPESIQSRDMLVRRPGVPEPTACCARPSGGEPGGESRS